MASSLSNNVVPTPLPFSRFTSGAAWADFHRFRHTYASLMLPSGANVLQLSRALGHRSPAFTLTVYTHLLDGEHAPALELGAELADCPTWTTGSYYARCTTTPIRSTG
jgi:hypothetical protein